MRKRSKYRPKGVRLDVVNYVVGGLKPVASHPAAVNLRIRNHAALAALTKGQATRLELDELIAALNITEALIFINPALGKDWQQEINEGQDALFAVAQRGAKTSRFILTGPEMKALNTVMEIHDAQIDQATIAELEKAIDMVNEFIAKGKTRRIQT